MNHMKIILVISAGLICISSAWAIPQKSCSITCYEKTPDCYVTKDRKGCLTISNEKPKKNADGDLMCVIPGCEEVKQY